MPFAVMLFGLLAAVAIYLALRPPHRSHGVTEEQFRALLNRVWTMEERLRALEARGGARGLSEAGAVTPAAPSASEGIAREAPAAPPATAPAMAAPPPAPPRRPDLETVIAGRWLNYVGIIALLFGAAFFLKYAFENDWIGPAGRVAVGLLAGAALLAFSQWLLGRDYRYFSEGLAGLGCAVLYLSLYAGYVYYHLFGMEVSFAGMVAVVILTALLAMGRASQRIAVLAAIGGFLTPLLLSTGSNQEVALFSYVFLLDAALVTVAGRRGWRSLLPLCLAGTQLYFWLWYATYYMPRELSTTLFFTVLFFAFFLAAGVYQAWRGGPRAEIRVVVAVLNAFVTLFAFQAMFWPQSRWSLTLAVLLLAASHVIVAYVVRGHPAAAPEAPLLYAGIALTLATIVFAIPLEGRWLTMAWAVEGAVLAWTGFRIRFVGLRVMALVLLGTAAFRLFAFPIDGGTLLLNARFITFVVVVACIAAAVYFARVAATAPGEGEAAVFRFAAVGANVLAMVAVSLEVWDVFAAPAGQPPTAGRLAQQLALSLVWSVYAAAMIAAGVRRSWPAVRWQGLALFALVVGKVFFFDLSFLQRGYRILSFMVLGLLLLVVSFLYQRRLASARPGGRP